MVLPGWRTWSCQMHAGHVFSIGDGGKIDASIDRCIPSGRGPASIAAFLGLILSLLVKALGIAHSQHPRRKEQPPLLLEARSAAMGFNCLLCGVALTLELPLIGMKNYPPPPN